MATLSEIFGHGFTGHGQAVAVQETLIEQVLHERADTADGDEFAHQVGGRRAHVGQHRHAFWMRMKSSMANAARQRMGNGQADGARRSSSLPGR